MRRVLSLLICTVVGGFAQPTDRPTNPPAFEVASVKLAIETSSQARADHPLDWGYATGRVNLRGIPLARVLLKAFGISGFQLSAPGWVNTACYDIVANAPQAAPREQVPLMFQTLLAERFDLAFHRETKITRVYALVVADSGPKLKEASTSESADPVSPNSKETVSGGGTAVSGVGSSEYGTLHYTIDIAKNTIHGEYAHMSMADLAEALSGTVDLPVVDMTGLQGFYRVTVDNHITERLSRPSQEVGRPVPIASDPSGDPVRESLQKQGLKLVRRDIPMEQVIVDHIARTPSEN